MNRRPLVVPPAALAFVVGAYTAFQRFLPLAANRDPSALGAISGLVDIVGFFLSPIAVFALAYWFGRRLDVPTEWRRVAAAFGAYGGVAFVAGFAVAAIGFVGSLAALPGLVVMGVYTGVFRAVSFTLVGVAGAAVADYRHR